MPYDPEDITRLSAENFDFTRFDWRLAKLHLKAYTIWCRLEEPKVMVDPLKVDARDLHVTYSLARGRPIVGKRGIEQPNTEIPISKKRIAWVLELYELPPAEMTAEAAA